MKETAIVLCSGGMDSCVTAAIAAEKYHLAFLHLNYGQKTEKRELKSFHDIADFYSVKNRLVIDTSFLKQIGGSSLTDDTIDVDVHGNLQKNDIPNSYVPFRNANILAMAVSWAEVISAKKIFIGAVEEDSSGYPDCRDSFFKTFNDLIVCGAKNGNHIQIETPIIHLNKAEIVNKAILLNAPLNLTWSCYKYEDKACGKCDSCLLRLRGFRQAGIEDPIAYVTD